MFFNKTTIDYRDNLNGTYTLLEDLILTMSDWGNIGVPKGFTWDGASIPRFFWRVCGSPMHPENVRASCIHDFTYKNKLFIRKKCDILFYKILRHDGKNFVIANGMYQIVRIFGSKHYG